MPRDDVGAAKSPTGSEPPFVLPPAELLWKSLTDSIDCFVVVLGPDLRIRYLNRVDVGYAAVGEVIGREMLEFIVPEAHEAVRRILREVFATGRTASYDVAGRGEQVGGSSYSVRVSPVEQDGRVVAAVCTAMDARRLHDTERALRAERQALRQFIRTQERERQLISYEIHDGLAQYLAGALMQFESCSHAIREAGGAVPASMKAFDEGLRLVQAAATESRRLINGLRPPMLDELGIVEAIESLVVEARADIGSVAYSGPRQLPRLDPNVETTLFRIVQESLTNSRKHSRANSAVVTLEERGDRAIAAVVEDDGIGFDPSAVPEGCFGLEGMRQRARLFGRETSIRSSPGGGTRVEIVLPRFPDLEGKTAAEPGPVRSSPD